MNATPTSSTGNSGSTAASASPAASGSDSASAGAASSPASSAPAGPPQSSADTPSNTQPSFAPLVGQWTPADGEGRSLVIYADRSLGIGQAGGQGQPMCDGIVQAASNGAFPINVACSDYGTYGLSLTADNGRLTLHMAADGNRLAQQVTWVRAQTPHTVGGSTAVPPPWMVGTWTMTTNPSYETFTVSTSGTVAWSLENQLGQYTHGTATLESVGDGTFRVHTGIGAKTLGGFWQFVRVADGNLQVIGGYAANEFSRDTASPSPTR